MGVDHHRDPNVAVADDLPDHIGRYAQVQQEQLAYQKLRLQTAQLGSPQNIISTAEGQLGMTQPASVTYLSPSTTTAASSSSRTATASGGTSQAPAGDANWPAIKSQLVNYDYDWWIDNRDTVVSRFDKWLLS